MFRFIILFAAILLTSAKLYSQPTKRANVWYFGFNAGIDFNSGSPKELTDSKMEQWEGCSSICDEKGNLVLYTNGIKIWNRKHQIISGDMPLGGNNTSTQSALILPQPGNKNRYYVFTTNTQLTCIVVDIALNNGDGEIVSRKLLLENATEKLAATQHCNKKDTWILSHEPGNNTFKCFLLSELGLSPQSVSSETGTAFESARSLGHMKFSPAADKLALAYFGKNIFELFKFDNLTGIVSNPVSLMDPDFSRAYGLEFSPNGEFLYVGKTLYPVAPIYQLEIKNLDKDQILKSKTIVGSVAPNYYGAMQLGPDNKIYIARNESNFLSIITKPNLKGENCSFKRDGFRINSGMVGIGLPNFPSSFFEPDINVVVNVERDCDKIKLSAQKTDGNVRLPSRWQWYKNEEPIDNAVEQTYIPLSSGYYSVTVRGNCDSMYIYSLPVYISVLECNPSWIKLDCGSIRLSANANSRFQWYGKNVPENVENRNSIDVTGIGKEVYKLVIYDSTNTSCFVEKNIDVDFGICDARLLIPDIFTPNGDGVNEDFKISVTAGVAKKLSIFNRWGEVIFSDSSSNPAWNGKVQGKDAQTGIYTYILEYMSESKQEFRKTGTVILQR